MSDRQYWLWLATLEYIYSPQITNLLEKFESPREIYEAEYSDYIGIARIGKKEIRSLCNKDMRRATQIGKRVADMGAYILTIDDEFYPESLRQLHNPPYVLYVAGEKLNWNDVFSISVVGSRKCTDYGIENAKRICADLAKEGVVIVSGLAKGIDAAAHTAALEAGVKTIAFLGNGIDVVYPPENKALTEAIKKNGAIMSEYVPGTGPFGKNFPIRNRLIAAFSKGTLVVEADEVSGALITAEYALENGKDVYAVPGDVGRTMSSGCNSIIKSGSAKLTDCADDILEEYAYEIENLPNIKKYIAEPVHVSLPDVKINEYKGEGMESKEKKVSASDPRYDSLDDESRAIIEVLCEGERHIDQICRITNMRAADVSSMLTLLELEGFVVALSGKRFALNI